MFNKILVTSALALATFGCSGGGGGQTTGGNTTPPPANPPATETPAMTPSESPAGTPGESPAGSPGESPAGTPSESPAGTPGESPAGASGGADAGFEKAKDEPGYKEVLALGKNPVASSPESIKKGEEQFKMYCATCHGDTGKGDGPGAAAITTGPPRDLTDAASYKYGSGDLSIFRTAKYGIPNTGMAAVAVPDDDLWNIVNYVKSLQSS